MACHLAGAKVPPDHLSLIGSLVTNFSEILVKIKKLMKKISKSCLQNFSHFRPYSCEYLNADDIDIITENPKSISQKENLRLFLGKMSKTTYYTNDGSNLS